MLINIIANFLQISEEKSKKIMDILSLQNQWQAESATIKKQSDFIDFLQTVGQQQWFKGHDYSKITDNHVKQELNEKYYALFTGVGLTQAISYNQAMQGAPDVSVVLGASEGVVKIRVNSLKQDILSGYAPKENIIYGLGCNRKLGVSVVSSEEESKSKLEKKHQEATEMNMVSLLVEEMLVDLIKLDNKFKLLSYRAVNTISDAKTREDKNCINTPEIALSLKSELERQQHTTKIPNIATYSHQPFVERQRRDIAQKLGANYNIVGVGHGLSQFDFNLNPKNINIFLAEIAKLININYFPANLQKYNIPLTDAELAEINNLFNPNEYKFSNTQLGLFDKKPKSINLNIDKSTTLSNSIP